MKPRRQAIKVAAEARKKELLLSVRFKKSARQIIPGLPHNTMYELGEFLRAKNNISRERNQAMTSVSLKMKEKLLLMRKTRPLTRIANRTMRPARSVRKQLQRLKALRPK